MQITVRNKVNNALRKVSLVQILGNHVPRT